MSEQWLNDIRHKVSQHKEPAPMFSTGEWDTIAASLPLKTAIRFPVWTRIAVAAAVLLGVLGVSFHLLQPSAQERIAANPIPVQLEYPKHLSRPMETSKKSLPAAGEPSLRTEIPEKTDEPTPKEHVPEVIPTPEPTPRHVPQSEKESEPEGWESSREDVRRSHRFTAQAFLCGSAGAQTALAPRLMSANVIGKNDLKMQESSSLETNGGTEIEIQHRLPIRVGISFSYELSRGWGLESGVTFSFHSSTFKTPSSRKNQELLFVGIPLNLNYRFCQWKRLSLYASAGVLMEKMISGTLLTVETGYRERVEMRPLQFSVSGAIGLDYRLSSTLSLYAEPGLRYSFDNGSTIKTIYTDRPFDGNLTMGLRVHF